jgi:hypothetical protein
VNPTQLAQQIRHKLQSVAWPSGGSVVFGANGVRVFAGDPSEDQIPPQRPFALIGIGPSTADPDDPDILEQSFTAIVVAEVAGDSTGEFALIGGAVADMSKSAGKGVAEIAERVRSVIQSLTGVDGARILISATSSGGTQAVGANRHLAMQEMTFSAMCTAQPYYTAPQRIRYSPDDTLWQWAGVQCSSRFDFWRYRLVEKDGSAPSTSPSDGTVVYTGTAASAEYEAEAGNVYTVFADYDARGRGAVEGSSALERGSYLVI